MPSIIITLYPEGTKLLPSSQKEKERKRSPTHHFKGGHENKYVEKSYLLRKHIFKQLSSFVNMRKALSSLTK